jgi:hypothetical protein
MNGGVVDRDAAFDEEFLHVSIRESGSEAPADCEHDDFGWEPVASEGEAYGASTSTSPLA